MRLGRERPRKTAHICGTGRTLPGFNEAGARTPQKGWRNLVVASAQTMASMRLGRERPRKFVSPPPVQPRKSGFNEAGARTPQKARGRPRGAA